MPLIVQLFGEPKDKQKVTDHIHQHEIALEAYVPQKRVMPPMKEPMFNNAIPFDHSLSTPDFSGPDIEADIDKLFAALQRKMVSLLGSP